LLILRKITEIVATRCHAPNSFRRSSDLLAGFKGPTSKGRERRKDGKEGQGKAEREVTVGEGVKRKVGKGKGEEGRVWKGRGKLCVMAVGQWTPMVTVHIILRQTNQRYVYPEANDFQD